jgi:hypothetical protein
MFHSGDPLRQRRQLSVDALEVRRDSVERLALKNCTGTSLDPLRALLSDCARAPGSSGCAARADRSTSPCGACCAPLHESPQINTCELSSMAVG